MFGPKQIDVGHLRYNRAIQESFTKELLLNLVRLKYRETPEFVDIGGVAAQYNFEASANASGKFFDFIDNFRGIGFGGSLPPRDVPRSPTHRFAVRTSRPGSSPRSTR